jgi:hypothetical protein
LTSIAALFDPANSLPEVVDAARQGAIDALPASLLLIKLNVALADKDLSIATAIVAALDHHDYVGHELFRARTGAMLVARLTGNLPAFDEALARWLDGRTAYPANWDDAVLADPVFTPWLDELSLESVAVQAHAEMSEADRAFIKDVDYVIARAVQENMEWLAPLGAVGGIAETAKRYAMIAVDRDLREVTLRDGGELPDLIVAIDEAGGFVGSFISH